ncbi:alanine racemase, partial [Treponema sp. R6D11]
MSKFKKLTVSPVMELQSSVVLIKKIKKGGSVSYGRTWIAEKDTLIGVISVGYADGLPRLASNRWQVLIEGEFYPIVGRISMDQCCVELGKKTKVKRWDTAVIFGNLEHDASALAKITGTIPYEITCNVNKRVPRVY